MPLHDGVYERAKCGYKLLQYAASGVPAVGSPVGVNVSILERDGRAWHPATERTGSRRCARSSTRAPAVAGRAPTRGLSPGTAVFVRSLAGPLGRRRGLGIHVVHVITKGDVGGAQTHVVELSAAQVAAGDEVTVLAGSDGTAMDRAAPDAASTCASCTRCRNNTTAGGRDPRFEKFDQRSPRSAPTSCTVTRRTPG